MTLLDPGPRRARGVALATQVRGAPCAEPATPHEESWRDFIFAEVWARPGLDRRARFFISITGALLAPGAGDLDSYLRGSLSSGEITLPELREAALHLSVYAGWGRGGMLDAAVTRVANELGLAPAVMPAIRAEPWNPQERLDQGHANFAKVMTFPPGPPRTPYYEAINNFVFGEMWTRDGLDQRGRRWMTLVAVCDSGAGDPIRSHIFGAIQSGDCSPDEIQEFVLQYGVHAGWPKASEIQAIALEIIGKIEKGLPWRG